jgi:hypothetical protein
MRRIVPLWCGGVLWAISSSAAAQPVGAPEQEAGKDPIEGPAAPVEQKDIALSRRGIAMALRSGWGIPQGQSVSGRDLADSSIGLVPVWLDLGYRFTDSLLVGIYAQYAFSVVRHCPGDLPCNASDVRFGFQAQWHFGVREDVDRWVGIGTGFEIYDEDVAGMTQRFGGYEFVNLQFGEDFTLGHRFGLGPFVAWTLGQFTGVQRGPSDSRLQEFDISKRALHSWVIIGLRFSYGA